ncbi:MAG: GNAT family N-acetyltransferase [Lachnospiraceae bacterium]|nr:GNAT family N-acetyltransferase [Lachnospiraceae bacterium]
MKIRAFTEKDIPAMNEIWNEVVEDGIAFPQEELLDGETGAAFFGAQTYCGVAETEACDVMEACPKPGTEAGPEAGTGAGLKAGTVVGLYILHPNNIGRCGHIANASYAVRSSCRGLHVGEMLVKDCLKMAKEYGFRAMQFNAVVESNIHARHLYERLGFVQLGTIPGGFRMKDGHYENICPYYHEL